MTAEPWDNDPFLLSPSVQRMIQSFRRLHGRILFRAHVVPTRVGGFWKILGQTRLVIRPITTIDTLTRQRRQMCRHLHFFTAINPPANPKQPNHTTTP